MSIDLKGISKLCENLNLDEKDDPAIRMDQAMYVEGKLSMDFCSVKKIFGNKSPNREALERVMKLLWKISHKIHVKQLGSNNIFVFHFGSNEDY